MGVPRRVSLNGAEYVIEVLEYRPARDGNEARIKAQIDGKPLEADVRDMGAGQLRLTVASRTALVRLARTGNDCWVAHAGSQGLIRPLAGKTGPALSGNITPPMPAVVARLLAKVGQRVERGQALVVVSAMKMETSLVAPWDGTVTALNVAEGDKVSIGQVLCEVAPEEEGDGE